MLFRINEFDQEGYGCLLCCRYSMHIFELKNGRPVPACGLHLHEIRQWVAQYNKPNWITAAWRRIYWAVRFAIERRWPAPVPGPAGLTAEELGIEPIAPLARPLEPEDDLEHARRVRG